MDKARWRPVLVEGAVIVGSILLAFGIQAAWDESNERASVRRSLENVVLEVEVGLDELNQAIATNRARVVLFETFLELAPGEVAALPADSLDVILWSFLPPRTFDVGGSALSGLLAGGNLNLIEEPEVRAALVAWGGFPDEIDEDSDLTRAVAHRLQDMIARRGLNLASASRLRDTPYPGASDLAPAMSRLRGDPEVVGVLAQLVDEYNYFVSELERGLPLARELLDVVNRS